MAGGAPAGINILPGFDGCLTNNTRIRMTTMSGKRITTPSGTEMLEFPLNLNGRLKYAKRDAIGFGRCFRFSSTAEAVGSCGVLPTSLLALWNRSITEF